MLQPRKEDQTFRNIGIVVSILVAIGCVVYVLLTQYHKFEIFQKGPLKPIADTIKAVTSKPEAENESVLSKFQTTEIPVDADALKDNLSNLTSLLSQARVEPYYVNEELVGFKFAQIQKNSFFSDLRLEEGDVILYVNGQMIDSPQRALVIFGSLKNAKQIDLYLQRAEDFFLYRYLIQ